MLGTSRAKGHCLVELSKLGGIKDVSLLSVFSFAYSSFNRSRTGHLDTLEVDHQPEEYTRRMNSSWYGELTFQKRIFCLLGQGPPHICVAYEPHNVRRI